MEADAFCFDGDAALALKVHGIEDLFVHFALRQRAGHFEQAVRERGLAMVNVRDDAEIPYELRIHFFLLPVFSVARRNSNRLFGFFEFLRATEKTGNRKKWIRSSYGISASS